MSDFTVTREDEEFMVNEDYREEYKGYTMEAGGRDGLWKLKAPQQMLPNNLKGRFTSKELLRFEIDKHLAKKEEKENRPPQDKNTRKVQEIMKQRELEANG